MKALLHKHFTRTAEHHVEKAKHHAAIAKSAAGLLTMHKGAEGMDSDALSELLEDYISEHTAIGAEHQSMAEHSIECAKACAASGKGMGGDELMPLSISGIAPENPAQKLTAVPRFGGGPPLLQKAEIDPAFAHLARVSDDESGH